MKSSGTILSQIRAAVLEKDNCLFEAGGVATKITGEDPDQNIHLHNILAYREALIDLLIGQVNTEKIKNDTDITRCTKILQFHYSMALTAALFV